MMIIRPIVETDLNSLKRMAENAGVGFTSLPANLDLLIARIADAQAAFSSDQDSEENQSYLFVLEDTINGEIAGVCGIESALGLQTPWYNYHLGTLVHASPTLGVYEKSNTLTLSNDHTGCSELCTLFLDKDYRHSKNGSLLSKCRFMFMANAPARFNERVIAEMRGVSDAEGNSPFWDGLGSHFFAMPFAKADYLSGLGNKAFIAELMPKLPIYINLLNNDARAVIGKVHDNTLPALRMLEGEGFENLGYVDIFDGGPTIEANIRHIRAISNSVLLPVEIADTQPDETAYPCLVSNQGIEDYRCTLMTLSLPRAHQDGVIKLDQATADALQVNAGDKVRVVALSARQAQ